MNTLTFNHRDELIKIKAVDIVCFKADGNYTKLILTSSKELLLSLNLSHVYQIIVESVGERFQSDYFVRVGRSLIIRKAYIFSIQTLKGKLILKVPEKDTFYEINVSKDALKRLKEKVQNQQSLFNFAIYLRDLQTGVRYELKNGNNLFGRKSDKSVCDFQIDNNDLQISRLHYNIIIHSENKTSKLSISVIDLGSSNGTFVNGKSISVNDAVTVVNGTNIRAGKTNFIIEIIDSENTEIP